MKIEWRSCFRIGVTLLLLILSVMALPGVGDFLLGLLSATTPLLVGCVIAYLVDILMSLYEKMYFPKARTGFRVKSRRPVCLLLAFLSLLLVLVLLVSIVLPEFVSCVALLIDKIPGAIETAVAALGSWDLLTEELVAELSVIDWEGKIEQLIKVVTSGVGDVLTVLIGTISSVFSGIVTALIAVIFSIYLLFGKERIGRQYAKLMKRYVKPNITEKVNHVLATMNDCFRRYIVGQCTEAVILGVLCALGMWIFRFPYATMIGALVAFTALIPVAGAYIGAFVGAFMILTVDPLKAVLFLVYIVVLQQLEGNIIYPRVVGSSIGLPGVWVLAAVTIGGGLVGIAGMLLGVPLAATVYRLLSEDVNRCVDRDAQSIDQVQPTSIR